MTLLDDPTEAWSSSEDQHNLPSLPPPSTSSSLAVALSDDRPRLITRAMLREPALRDAWLDSIDEERTFLISKRLVPDLYHTLHTQQPQQLPPRQQQQLALPAAAVHPSSPRMSSSSSSPPSTASALSVSPSVPAPSSLLQLSERLKQVDSVKLSDAFSNRAKRLREDHRSSSIGPPPPLHPPLTPPQQRLFDLVASNSLSAFTSHYSPTVMSINLPHPTHGATLLHLAAVHSLSHFVAHLLSLSADPNARSFNDSTPLHWAAGAGSFPCVQLLLQAGAEPLARTMTWWMSEGGRGSGRTAAHWAGESGRDEVVELLMDFEPGVLVEEDERGRTVRDVAEAEGQRAVVATLKERETEEYVGVKLRLLYSGQQMKAMRPPNGVHPIQR